MAVVPAPAIPWSTTQLRLVHRIQLYVLMTACVVASVLLIYNVFSPAPSCAAELRRIPENSFESVKDGYSATESVGKRSLIGESEDERRLGDAVGTHHLRNSPTASVGSEGAGGGAGSAGARISSESGSTSFVAEDSPMPDGRRADELNASPSQETWLAGFFVSTRVPVAAKGEDPGEHPEKVASENPGVDQVEAQRENSGIDLGEVPRKDSGENPSVYQREAPVTRAITDPDDAPGKDLRKTLGEALGESPSVDQIEAPVKTPGEFPDETPGNASVENPGKDVGEKQFPVENSSDGEGRGPGKYVGSANASPARSSSRTQAAPNEDEVVYLYLWLAFVHLLLVLVCVVTSLHYEYFVRRSQSEHFKSGYVPTPLILEMV